MKIQFLFILLVSTLFIDCSNQKSNIPASTVQDIPAIDTSRVIKESVTKSVDDPALETGIILYAEDAGYPVISLTVNFPKRNWQEHFNLNVEEIKGLNFQKILASINKPIAITYKTEKKTALVDLQSGNNSILANPAPVTTKQLKKITGILSGAVQSTSGDLPDTLSITSAESGTVRFQYFITPEVVRYNGKQLTALYAERINNKVLSFNLVE